MKYTAWKSGIFTNRKILVHIKTNETDEME